MRVLVDNVTACYAALGVVHNLWSYLAGEFDDYIANPKENGYRSLHTAVIGPGKHLSRSRSARRTCIARRSSASPRTGVTRKARRTGGFRSENPIPSAIARAGARGRRPAGTDTRRCLRGSRLCAEPERGRGRNARRRDTPLDFAYHVHTQVGHRCRGAKVNGRIVPLTYRVKNGDKIEIITGRQPHPSRDWLSPQLGYLAAARSRAKVQKLVSPAGQGPEPQKGRDILERELARLNVRDFATDDIAAELKLAGTDELCVALGAGDVTPTAVANAVQRLRKESPVTPAPALRRRERRSRSDEPVEIRGVGDLLCNLARCCRPVPPEEIVGYITVGRGVSIHRQDCKNFASLYSRHRERVIDVEWRDPSDENYPADLVLEAYDRQGLLRDVSAVLADEKVNVDSIHTRTDQQRMQAQMELRIFVPGLATLSSVMGKLEQLPNVTSVRRKS